MNIVLIALALIICGGVISLKPDEAPGALAFCALASVPTIFILARSGNEKTFLFRMFLIAVLVRIIIGTVIFTAHLEEFFGGDANTYDIFGQSLVQAWHGDAYHAGKSLSFVQTAATAIVVYYTAQTLFSNTRVSKVAAVLVAFFPSLVLWSSQALKDALIILALALCILATLKLMDKISFRYMVVLGVCLSALLSLRFYIFYMM